MRHRLSAALAACAMLLQAGCAAVDFTHPGPTTADYDAAFPYSAELCAVSQILKKPGYGAEIRGQPGGHAIFFMHGACRARENGPTTLALCDTPQAEPADGAGISMNAHFATAKWVASPGRDFVFWGGLDPAGPLTQNGYQQVQARAKSLGIYTGVDFHDEVFDDMPPGTSREDWKYEMSVATDYAIGLGRGRVCARIPLSRAQMVQVVDFLNQQNAPYREHRQVFEWELFEDNCNHLAHNALAAAGVWPVWPTHLPLPLAMLNFPVPRNEVINLLRHTNATDRLDPVTIYEDPVARDGLLRFGMLPLWPGALMESAAPLAPNQVYDRSLTLLFYNDPILGPYQRWSDAIAADPRRTDLAANLAWVRATYAAALRAQHPLETYPQADNPAFAATYKTFYATLAAGISP